nr:hypothetical protein [uncultured Draconibacterium sp.]
MKDSDYDEHIKKYFGTTTNFEREVSQYYIEDFATNIDNHFDYSINQVIGELKEKLRESELQFNQNWVDEKKCDSDDELVKYASLRMMLNQDISNYYEELFALFETRIIYAYKLFEISIKTLFNNAYKGDKNFSGLYKWDNLKELIKSKGINIKTLQGYEEVNQLRNVSNSLKHSGKSVNESIVYIPEFKGKEILSYNDLENFYNRIDVYPVEFIEAISSIIIADLYEFDDKKINIIARSLALRMNKETATKLSKTLLGLYE